MKTIAEIRSDLMDMESIFGFPTNSVEQGSKEWLIMKLGVLSATGADSLLAGPTTGKRKGYIAKKVAEIATGQSAHVTSKQMDWGNEHEDAARSFYEFYTGNVIEELPIVYRDTTYRTSCSPDGLGEKKGFEVKNPFTSQVYIEFITDDKIKTEYIKQCQFGMWVTKREEWDFANYDKRMLKHPFHYVTLERDPKMMKSFDDAVPSAVREMDLMLEKIGMKFGDHWEHIRNNEPTSP